MQGVEPEMNFSLRFGHKGQHDQGFLHRKRFQICGAQLRANVTLSRHPSTKNGAACK